MAWWLPPRHIEDPSCAGADIPSDGWTAASVERAGAIWRQVAALLQPELPVPGVTLGAIRQELNPIGVISRAGGGPLNLDSGDLAVTARWGFRGSGGVTMAGSGKAVGRAYAPLERKAIEEWGNPLGLSLEESFAPLGESTFDIYLNDRAYWRNVPARVWEYKLDGYQVMKKWLSYREFDVLGREMTETEARQEVRDMARRIAAILLLEPKLNANYHSVQTAVYGWQTEAASTELALQLW